MHFFPLPSYLVSLIPIYSPQHPSLQHPQSIFVPQYERPSFTPMRNNRQNCFKEYKGYKHSFEEGLLAVTIKTKMDVKLIPASTLMLEAAYPCEVPTFLPDIKMSHPTTQMLCTWTPCATNISLYLKSTVSATDNIWYWCSVLNSLQDLLLLSNNYSNKQE